MNLHPEQTDAAVAPELDTSDGFTAWIEPHWTAMALLATRLAGPSGQDVLQDAATQAWRARARFDPSRGSARTWLLTLVADQARKSRRRLARRHEQALADQAELSSPTLERDLDIERAIARLSDRQRLAVGLYYYLGLPIAEVATVMRCADGTVKSTLADARTRLQDYLGKDFV